MPTPRSPNVDKRSDERKQAEKIYLESKGSLKLVEIAEKLKVPANKVRKWKSMDGWEAKLSPTKADNGKKNKWSVPLRIKGAFHVREVLQRATRMQWEVEAIRMLSRQMRQSMEGTQLSTGIRWMKMRRISLRICQRMRKNC